MVNFPSNGTWISVAIWYSCVGPSEAADAPPPGRRYPQDALRCFATSAEPTRRIVCPEDRNGFCVKEVANTSRGDCGTTFEYSRDRWDRKLGQCAYRKCSATCQNEGNVTTWFGPDGDAYERVTYCCDSELCNSAPPPRAAFRSGLTAAASACVAAALIVAALR